MSTYTKNYKLIKPSYDEDIDVQDINNNMDVLDNTINGLDTDVQNITRHIGVIDNTIADLDFVQNAYKDTRGLHLNKRGGSVIDIPLNYLPLTGGRISGRTHIDSMLSVGQSSAIASNIRVDGTAGNAYIALLNYNNEGTLLIDGYFNTPETAKIDVTNRNAQGAVLYRSTLMDGSGNAKFANEVYAKGKLLATKEYVDGKKYPYLPIAGGTVTGDLNVGGALLVGGIAPQYEIERKTYDSNENYTLQSIKYSNGVLEQVVRMKKFANINEQVTFLVPFNNTDNISLSNGTYSLATDTYKEPYNDWVWSVANLSTTGAKFKASGYYSRPCYVVRGYWK